MTQENVKSLVRHILSIVAGYLITKGIMDSTMIEPITGTVLAIISFVWSWKSKTVTSDALSGIIRQILSTVGGVLFFYGKNFDVNTIMSFVTMLSPYLLKLLGKKDETTTNQ